MGVADANIVDVEWRRDGCSPGLDVSAAQPEVANTISVVVNAIPRTRHDANANTGYRYIPHQGASKLIKGPAGKQEEQLFSDLG